MHILAAEVFLSPQSGNPYSATLNKASISQLFNTASLRQFRAAAPNHRPIQKIMKLNEAFGGDFTVWLRFDISTF